MTAYQREVCSWEICVLLHLCVLSLLNLYCVQQALEQRGAGHRHSTVSWHLADFIFSLFLSFYIEAQSLISSNSHLSFLFLIDRSLKAVSIIEYQSILEIILGIKNWIWRGRSAQKSGWASQKTVVQKMSLHAISCGGGHNKAFPCPNAPESDEPGSKKKNVVY